MTEQAQMFLFGCAFLATGLTVVGLCVWTWLHEDPR